MLISQLMAAELTAEMAMTRKLLARVPSDKLGWKPSDGLHTIGWNASHLVEIAGWVPTVVRQGEYDIAPAGCEPSVVPDATDTAALLKSFDGNQAQALAAL